MEENKDFIVKSEFVEDIEVGSESRISKYKEIFEQLFEMLEDLPKGKFLMVEFSTKKITDLVGSNLRTSPRFENFGFTIQVRGKRIFFKHKTKEEKNNGR